MLVYHTHWISSVVHGDWWQHTFFSLSDSEYVSDRNETCLISWTKMNVYGTFRILSEDRVIIVEHESDPSAVFVPQWMHEHDHVLPLSHH